MEVNRGEVWFIDLNPVIGHEQSGIRPALIISDNMFNHSLADMVIVVPITSKFRNIPTHVAFEADFLKTKSYIRTEDIRSVSKIMLTKKIGTVGPEIISLVENRIKYLLGIE